MDLSPLSSTKTKNGFIPCHKPELERSHCTSSPNQTLPKGSFGHGDSRLDLFLANLCYIK
jgi:hypothetical protein